VESCLIADDHPLVRDALSLAIATRWPDAVIWEAVDYPTAWEVARRQPDISLVDLGMAGSQPREGVRRMRMIAPQCQVLIVTGSTDDTQMLNLLADGVAGFLLKSAQTSAIIAAIESVLAGGRYVPPRLADVAGDGVPDSNGSRLSARQIDVLRLVADGRTNKEIARVMGIAPATVKSHVAYAMAALDASNRTEAAIRARAAGVI
jgi:DNA-binding NarL/FixJ family response regulator